MEAGQREVKQNLVKFNNFVKEKQVQCNLSLLVEGDILFVELSTNLREDDILFVKLSTNPRRRRTLCCGEFGLVIPMLCVRYSG